MKLIRIENECLPLEAPPVISLFEFPGVGQRLRQLQVVVFVASKNVSLFKTAKYLSLCEERPWGKQVLHVLPK